jgi:TPP-dependent pyruvate/acetoin dehydrogenase alpha subunit
MKDQSYRGSRIMTVRMDDDTIARIQAQVDRSVTYSKDEPYTIGGWIKKAVAEKLAHLERSKKPSKRDIQRRQMRDFSKIGQEVGERCG